MSDMHDQRCRSTPFLFPGIILRGRAIRELLRYGTSVDSHDNQLLKPIGPSQRARSDVLWLLHRSARLGLETIVLFTPGVPLHVIWRNVGFIQGVHHLPRSVLYCHLKVIKRSSRNPQRAQILSQCPDV